LGRGQIRNWLGCEVLAEKKKKRGVKSARGLARTEEQSLEGGGRGERCPLFHQTKASEESIFCIKKSEPASVFLGKLPHEKRAEKRKY